MKLDPAKYPGLPPGSQGNYNNRTRTYQVFLEGQFRSPWCKTHRQSIGKIDREGKFSFSQNYLLQQKLHLIETVAAERDEVEEQPIKTVVESFDHVIADSDLETRRAQYCSVPMTALMLGSLMQALTGDTDCVSIGDFITRNKDFFNKYIPGCNFENVSHDTVRRALMVIEPARFENFYLSTINQIVTRSLCYRVVAADGQAVRASGRTSEGNPTMHEASMFMNFYDTSNRVCLAQRRIEKKTNEITVGPAMVECLDLRGCVVTADAMSCQVNFVTAVIKQGDYCISLKGNLDACWKEVSHLFASAHEDQIQKWQTKWEADHGRIEQRTVSMLRGTLLSKVIRDKWPGLSGGSVVKVDKQSTKKTTNRTTNETRYYITSLPTKDPETAKNVGEIIRAHWGVENNLHWMLDNLFRQDRMQADNPNYLTNRCALNKLALALLENYRFFLWNKRGESPQLSIQLLQQRCRDPRVAIECIGYALGWLE
jgi:predicted transposase YbfD/YdcC